MTIDILDLITEKGGNPELVRESQRKRGESVELVDEVIEMYKTWVKSAYPVFGNRVPRASGHLVAD